MTCNRANRCTTAASTLASSLALAFALALPTAQAGATRVAAGSAPAAVSRDALRLAQAEQDLLAAEQALKGDPAAAATFGPMLRAARARLEAGRTALAAQGGERVLPAPAADAEARALRDAGRHSPAGRMPDSTSNVGLQLRRRIEPRPLVWA